MTPRLITKEERLAKRNKSVGLGDIVKKIIHIVIDILPISKVVKNNIKGCKKCAERTKKLNKIIPHINSLR